MKTTLVVMSSNREVEKQTRNTLQSLANLGLLEETTGRKRNRRFSYKPYLALFRDDA